MRLNLAILLTFILASSPAHAGKVTFRADHAILVDGKPFFPVGLYYCNEEFEEASGKLLQALRDYGFNTLGYYRHGTPGWQKDLERAHRAGLKVWARGHNGFAIDSPEIEKAAIEQIHQLRDNPALLFWEFQDEPILNKVSVPGSRKGYALVKREDPNHPLLVVEWPSAVERFHEWRGIGDIFATDLYPIPRTRGYGGLPNKDITQMRDYLEALRKGYGDRPRLLVLQAWAWEPLKDGENGYPTPLESRFMAYQAVIHGAKGLHYYGQFHCTKANPAAGLDSTAKGPAVRKAEIEKCLLLNRQFWDRHRAFFHELDQARALFVLPEAAEGKRLTLVKAGSADGRDVEFSTRQHGKDLYCLVVNPNPQPRKATFRLPSGIDNGDVHVLFEGRKLTAKDRVFTDTFKGYEVHVYATTPDLPRAGE